MPQSNPGRTGDNTMTAQGDFKSFKDIAYIYSSKYSNVYKAINISSGKPVVLKTINESVVDELGTSFLRNEYHILSRISSDHVPKAIECSLLGEGQYLAVEYVEGISLRRYLENRRMSVKEFLHIAAQIVRALSDIHDAGVIHKDINPGNIIYNNATRKATIIDFGSATEFSRERSPSMEPGIPEGSLWYISPEQTGRMNHVIDFRTDFYSLGVTFFEMLCGRPPFESENQSQILYMHLAKTPPAPRDLNSGIPVMLSRLVGRLMEKMPEDRYQSAAGISHDLRKCLELVESGNADSEFQLGEGDHSGQFEIPQKTYGRDDELATLEAAYREVPQRGKELVAIAGHSGVGKTTLVGELHRHLAGTEGIFVYGKYDQYRSDIPFAAIAQALEQFCDFVLSENADRLAVWKNRITGALKKDGRLILDRIPRLALLAGEPDPLPDLSPLEERTKFKAALQDLLAAIASPDRILVMFFDDMHLANPGSFELVEEIMANEGIRGLLLIACYRDNEVDGNHPLVISLNKMVTRRMNVRQIALAGLDVESATRMMAESFHRDPGTIGELSSVIYGKTKGNPFYLRQFLKLCHKSGYVRFDRDARSWAWDINAIRHCEAEDNVVDFLVRNIDMIQPETRALLSLGACVGRVFKVGTLADISGKRREEVLEDLRQAVAIEVLYSLGGGAGRGGDAEFQFAHDRFQQAFYTILAESGRIEIHHKLALLYEELGYGEDESSERQFVLADSYSKCYARLRGDAEKRRAAEILYRTSKAASLRSAFGIAVRYLELVIGSLPVPGESEDFRFAVYAEYHSTLCGLAKYAEADKAYATLESFAMEPIRLTDNCCLQAISLSNRGKYKEAFMMGVELLGKLGVSYPAEDLQGAVARELGAFYSELGGESFPGVEQLPKSDSAVESSIAKILNRISTAGLFHNAFCAFWAIITNAKRVLENGYTRDGLPLYGSMTLVLIPFRNDYRLSYSLALGAMRLAEKNGYRVFRMYHLFSLINSHWYEDPKTGMAYARESCRGNTAFGDFEFACFSYFTTQQLVLETCQSIDELAEETKAALAYAESHGNLHALRNFVSFRQFSRTMVRDDTPVGCFDDGTFTEATHLAEIAGNQMALCFFYILRALSATIFMDFDKAFELTEKALPCMPSITGFYFTALHKFLHSLSICKRIESGACGPDEEAALTAKLAANQKWLGERAADAPANFRHLFDLIEAERNARKGDSAEIISLFEKAMAGARRNGRPYHYALACDLAAQRFLALDAPVTAASFLREALHAYGSWGAKGKVQQMRQQFIGHRLFDLEEAKRLSPSPTPGINKAFDFNSLILASQAISRETRTDTVLESLMNVLLENAGAQDIYYLAERNGEYVILAECHAEGEGTMPRQAEVPTSARISIMTVNYVARSRETVVLDNASESEAFSGDEHIAGSRCKSVMCIPVVNKGALKGLLYLENNLIEGAFDKQRIDALNTIATQLAISLENAYLFDNLQRLVDERTRELREEIAIRKQAENRLEQMANCDMLTKLPNRRMFYSCLDHSIELALANNGTVAVLFIDLDGFKAINDRHGHDKGDIVLVTTAKRLVDAVRGCDTVSRLGGDEFVLILENVKTIKEIEIVCRRIISSVERPIDLEGMDVKAVVTSSIGISLLRVDGMSAEELITSADSAMYIAKKNGKNQHVFHAKDHETAMLGK